MSNTNTPTVALTANYTASYKAVRVTWYMDGSASFATLGDVSDDEVAACVAAEGADVAGFECVLV